MTFAEWNKRDDVLQLGNSKEVERLRLETELQAILGKLSMMKIGDKGYDQLDKDFIKVIKRLKELK